MAVIVSLKGWLSLLLFASYGADLQCFHVM